MSRTVEHPVRGLRLQGPQQVHTQRNVTGEVVVKFSEIMQGVGLVSRSLCQTEHCADFPALVCSLSLLNRCSAAAAVTTLSLFSLQGELNVLNWDVMKFAACNKGGFNLLHKPKSRKV